jgi:hypothetical protein
LTRERAKELLPVLTAWANGEVVQLKPKTAKTWVDVEKDAYLEFRADHDWRIKPKAREFVIFETNQGVLFAADKGSNYAFPVDCKAIIHVREVLDE